MCGPKTYQLVHNLAVPGKPTDRDFAALVKLIGDHYSPAPSVIVQRCKFNSRQGESIVTYIVKLRRLSEFCQFGDTLYDMLRDRLVCGVNDPASSTVRDEIGLQVCARARTSNGVGRQGGLTVAANEFGMIVVKALSSQSPIAKNGNIK